ncbi:MAG: NgoPII family restriction endonuclease [bacterium]
MHTNLLIALSNLANNPLTDCAALYKSTNRANGMGESLEFYIKDLFCGSTMYGDQQQKLEAYNHHFSYLGNQNNPPDIIIRGGDAIEVKKIESLNSGIALNSSYPKDKLYSNSPMITSECKNCENWKEKDLLYIIGVTKNNTLKSLWFIYGDCYAANSEIYERVRKKISSGLQELSDVEFAETNELGRVNRVDPLGITYLRIRGMWHIENPNKVFDYITAIGEHDFTVNALVLTKKYNQFPEADRKLIESTSANGLSIADVRIKSPNNPANLLDAKLITMKR